jgi:hypothetical protein
MSLRGMRKRFPSSGETECQSLTGRRAQIGKLIYQVRGRP